MSVSDLLGEDAGIVDGRAAFADLAGERRAEERLDRFMSEVLIPLAAQTNAIVFCNACPNVCILSASLTRMYAVQVCEAPTPRGSCCDGSGNARHVYIWSPLT